MSEPNLELTNAGLKVEGDWKEVCVFAKNIESFFDENAADERSVEEYDHWRPREEEDEKELIKRTARKACLDKKEVEEVFNGAREELEAAGENIKKGMNGEEHRAENIKEASRDIERLVEAESIKSIRKLEKMIYEDIMLRFNPYYFDTEDFSVNLEKISDGGDERYKLAINVSNEEMRKKIKDEVRKRTDH